MAIAEQLREGGEVRGHRRDPGLHPAAGGLDLGQELPLFHMSADIDIATTHVAGGACCNHRIGDRRQIAGQRKIRIR